MAKAKAQDQLKSTQNSLIVGEIKDGILVLKDGTLRSVVFASAINFDLMSSREQDAVEYAYQGFLNSLHFPIQILIRSQKVDLDNYIEKLSGLRAQQDNELLGLLMEDYIANIKGLIEEVNIMSKQFYVTVPYFPPLTTKTGFFSSLANTLRPQQVTTVTEQQFNDYKKELSQRVTQVTSGLNQIGIRAVNLNTQELVDLFYSSYNPDVAQNQKLIDPAQLQGATVTKGEGAAPKRTLPSAAIGSDSEEPK
ncbi:MAG TPA: hypothetical protein VLE72_02735 [Candidatus Saccharimonadales bacterium]|nr:hypothetical protein [Candidatus Saccharimonadales bacterium]